VGEQVIAQAIVELHGDRIWVESEVGQGPAGRAADACQGTSLPLLDAALSPQQAAALFASMGIRGAGRIGPGGHR
jgi:hypothetical protein